jgi:hypothetical protein
MGSCKVNIVGSNVDILEFDCLFNMDMFANGSKKYFLSKQSVDYLRYIIMFYSHEVYNYILKFYSNNKVCTTPYRYPIPIIKKNIGDNLGVVDYDQIKLYLLENFDKVMEFRSLNKGIKDIKQQLEEAVSQIGNLPGVSILPNGAYEIRGTKQVISEFRQLSNKIGELNSRMNQQVSEVNTIIQCCPLIDSTVHNSHLLYDKMLAGLTNSQIINTLMKFERDCIVTAIRDCKVDTMLILVDLEFFIHQSGNFVKQEAGHANSLVIRKDGNTILAIRTEPHRHSNIYCRNSVRKAIREIFTNIEAIIPNANFVYIDYIISSKVGLQTSEEAYELEDNDFDSLQKAYKVYSPLKGNSGFCASWTLYISLLILLNPSLGIQGIGDYLQHLNVPVKIKSVDEIINESQSMQAVDITRDLNKLVKDGYLHMNISNQSDPNYIITKHRKLYMMILTALYILKYIIDQDSTAVFDDYIERKLAGSAVQKSKRNVRDDNQVISKIMGTIQSNYVKFTGDIRNNVRQTINLNTGSLYDKHKEEDARLLQQNACNRQEITKHNKQVAEENLVKFRKIQQYIPKVSGYIAGGSYERKYLKYKIRYLKMKGERNGEVKGER